MAERAAALDAVLARCGLAAAPRAPLAGDASFRRYLRIADGAARYVVMDAPPPQEDVRPFMRVARHLCALGLSAPQILAADEAAGFLLVEDFGDTTFTRALAAGDDEAALYELATDALIALQTHPQATAIDLPRQDAAMLAEDGAALFVDWWLPEATGRPTPPDLRAGYLALWHAALEPALDLKPTLALRDFHVDNLMVLAGRAGAARCGLLDFQDAAIGSPAYDLVSLLEDSRRDVAPAVAASMRARHRAACAHLPATEFDRACATLAAARHARIVGLWIRLWRRDRKPGYLAFLPRSWRQLETALRHPALTGLRDWFDRHAPPPARRATGREGR